MNRPGLTTREAQAAMQRGEVNIQPSKSQKSVKDIIKENTLTYFNMIFAVLAVLLIAAGAFRSLTILFAVVFNSMIGIIQQLRAKKILDDLSMLNQPTAIAFRDGKKVRLPIEQLVLGDVALFGAGSQICADAVVLSGEVSVNESLLTGESDEIPKSAGGELLSGSFIVSGECLAIVGFMILLYISKPASRYRVGVIIGCIVGFCVFAVFFRDLFAIKSLSKKCIMLLSCSPLQRNRVCGI